MGEEYTHYTVYMYTEYTNEYTVYSSSMTNYTEIDSINQYTAALPVSTAAPDTISTAATTTAAAAAALDGASSPLWWIVVATGSVLFIVATFGVAYYLPRNKHPRVGPGVVASKL